MIKIKKTEMFGLEAAVRGARNAYQSWDKSDGYYDDFYRLGDADLALLSRLSKAGADHGKFMRMIHVQADVTAPLFWWKQIDAYKVGTVTNSCSTMHSIHKKTFTETDFSMDGISAQAQVEMARSIETLNMIRTAFLKTKSKKYWRDLIVLLPESYNQMRTIDLNYAVLQNIYHQRKNHRLSEWHDFCNWISTLPYAEDLITMQCKEGG